MIFDKIEEKILLWNESFKDRLLKLCPPGYELTGEYRVFWICLVFGIVYSMQFFVHYTRAYDSLFYYSKDGWVLNEALKIPPFGTLVEGSFAGLWMGAICLGYAFAEHFIYYRKESKSIYLMKRLQDRRLLWKTYWGTACIYGLLFVMTGVVLLGIYYGIYRFVTPQSCLNL